MGIVFRTAAVAILLTAISMSWWISLTFNAQRWHLTSGQGLSPITLRLSPARKVR